MQIHGTSSQAIRRVFENGHAVADNGAGTLRIVCHMDASSGTSILLWDDVKAVFSNALYARSEDLALSFLKGPDFKNLDPLRIAAIPDVTLDVVVTGPEVVASPPPAVLQAPPSRCLTYKNTEEWAKTISQDESFLCSGINISPDLLSEVSSTTACAETGSLWSERVQGIQREGSLSSEVPDVQEIQYQQRIRSEPSVSEGVYSALTSFTPGLVNMTARANSGDHVAQKPLGNMNEDGRFAPKDVQEAIDWYLTACKQGISISIVRKLLSTYHIKLGAQQEYLIAMDWHRKEAYEGHSTAQCNVGHLYFAVKDYGEAMHWYRMAAKQDTAAYYNIGYLYCYGQGVSQDYAEAMIGYRKSAEQGHAKSQCNIGYLYQQGFGVSQDYFKAMAWYRKSAEQGHAKSQCNIGDLYQHGLGVSRDYAEAMIWYRKSAEQGHAKSQCNIGDLYQHGLGVSRDYAEAMIWYQKAANQGNANAQNSIGELYYYGHGVPKDYVEAMSWYRKSAEQGYAKSLCNIGYLYQQGFGVSQDYAEAMIWHRKSAEQGYSQSQWSIGSQYQHGLGVSQDYVKAMTWYLKSARQGHAQSQCNVGYLYQQGLGVSQNYAQAMYWYKKSADQGYAQSQWSLGYLYQHGLGVPRDHHRAMVWYQKAGEQGQIDSMF